mgnify:FL=1
MMKRKRTEKEYLNKVVELVNERIFMMAQGRYLVFHCGSLKAFHLVICIEGSDMISVVVFFNYINKKFCELKYQNQ